MDKSLESYWHMRMRQQDIVERYITRLETIYGEHKILQRAKASIYQILMETDENTIINLFHPFGKLGEEQTEYMHSDDFLQDLPQLTGNMSDLLN